MDLRLRERVYVVTGASGGLGRAIAAALTGEGARVVVSGRDQSRIDAAAAAIGADSAIGVVADNADPAAATCLVDAAISRWGRLDGVAVSVGGPPAGAATSVTDQQWRESFESVFVGAVRTARVVAEHLGQDGSILFVLSSSVRQPIAGLAISNGLRPGLAMVAKTLADELGPRGIRVNAVLPGKIETDRIVYLDGRADDPAAARAAAEGAVPLRRYGQPDELGRAAAFLLSPAASYVSGVMLPVDGGAIRAL